MNKQEFIKSIKTVVLEGSINTMETVLVKPPGRSPSQNLSEISTWYNTLKSNDKEMALKVIRESIETSIYSFLCVLDGVCAIEGLGEKGVLKLYYEKNNESNLLNNNDEEYLHNLF